jgi:hypothetical protein
MVGIANNNRNNCTFHQEAESNNELQLVLMGRGSTRRTSIRVPLLVFAKIFYDLEETKMGTMSPTKSMGWSTILPRGIIPSHGRTRTLSKLSPLCYLRSSFASRAPFRLPLRDCLRSFASTL